MPSNPEEGGAAYIIGSGDHNAVFADPANDRDLNLMFCSRSDAEAHPERGEGLALWHGESRIVADPGPLGEELREGLTHVALNAARA